MNHSAIAAIGAVLLLAGSSLAVAAQADSDFLNKAIGINLAEIQMGQLAQKNGSTAGVRDFGATLVRDHSASNQDAMALAKNDNITPPNAPSDEDQKMYKELAGKSGADFDHTFSQDMVDGHQQAIKLFTDESNSATGDLKSFADKTLPTLKQHLASAQSLLDNPGAPAVAQTGGIGGAATGAMANATPDNANPQLVEPDKISLKDLRSAAVYDADNRKIGSVSDVILDKGGKIDAVVLDVGGFLGIGAKNVALALDALQVRQDAKKYLYVYTKLTKQQLEDAPKYDKDTYEAQRNSMRITTSSQ